MRWIKDERQQKPYSVLGETKCTTTAYYIKYVDYMLRIHTDHVEIYVGMERDICWVISENLKWLSQLKASSSTQPSAILFKTFCWDPSCLKQTCDY